MALRRRVMHRIDCLVQNQRLSLLIHDTELFIPNLMSWFSAAAMEVVPGETFCDVGTGSGLHAILAAKLGARRVYGIDLSPIAIRFARENAKRNGVEKACRFLLGSLIDPLAKRRIRVDAMIYNAPQFPGKRVDRSLPARLIGSVDGGPDGGQLNARFVREAWRALKPDGRIYNPLVGWAGPQRTARSIQVVGCASRVIAKARIPNWGRGNHTRAWFLQHPGEHRFDFKFRAGPDSRAQMLELSRHPRPGSSATKNLDVWIRFSPSKTAPA